MNAINMNIGEYRNIVCEQELSELFGDVVTVMKNFQSDIFMDYGNMCTIMGTCEETRKIWSIRKTGSWYMDVTEYNRFVHDMDIEPVLQFIVESNSYGEMTFTRIR